jgi:hypothetical protein
MQGHSNAAGGKCQGKANTSLVSLNLKQARHEPCLFCIDMIDAPGKLLCYPVEDMLLREENKEECHDFIKFIIKLLHMGEE